MWYLYVLKSNIFERKYIGITGNINARLSKHNSGSVWSTKAYRPWTLAYTEEFDTKTGARLRELALKKSGNKRTEVFKKIEARSSRG
ncbi:MAG: Excinuclease abc c subunit domain protein [Candidatus Curtissbacteria bacterium GW2011_GWA1_40_9]|uniref:Excinuclease abc c subunit domain protein n=1 Tax=Candidatus Curtissbacteria bacterium GW2011_GWA1_40_9 TaxID=1618408 RepID=A0A0G0TM74_9BACT|nr:MAG: Excinuclease abc c subunit domain protein [Candidatus Curtissbacteria bacterium GW2011_GWA1_40_9]